MKKYILVTGASRGIGYSIAEKLAENGYSLILVAKHSRILLEALKSKLETSYPISCHCLYGDLSESLFVDHLFRYIEDLCTKNDFYGIINNAGISHIGLLQDLTNDDWHEVLNTNLSSIFYTSKKSIPLFLKQGFGKIINLSSVWGNQGASCEVAYCASKGGVNAFTKALGKELALSNIQVNAIACGLIDTSMNAHLTSDEIAALKNEIPSNRMGTTDEVADLTLYLLNAPTYLTGQVITLDGGWQ